MFGFNSGYVEDLYAQYLQNPESVSASWRDFFADFNPGPTFTRNMDKKFADTVKELYRSTRDPSVRQILSETLDAFEATKVDDQGLGELISMWKKEKERSYKQYGVRLSSNQSPSSTQLTCLARTRDNQRRDPSLGR